MHVQLKIASTLSSNLLLITYKCIHLKCTDQLVYARNCFRVIAVRKKEKERNLRYVIYIVVRNVVLLSLSAKI